MSKIDSFMTRELDGLFAWWKLRSPRRKPRQPARAALCRASRSGALESAGPPVGREPARHALPNL
jgi:hypothetical protein